MGGIALIDRSAKQGNEKGKEWFEQASEIKG